MSVFPKILRKCGGSVELVDVSSELPQLVRRPGVRKWKVCYFCQVHFLLKPLQASNTDVEKIFA